jgi:hypothetical protein
LGIKLVIEWLVSLVTHGYSPLFIFIIGAGKQQFPLRDIPNI